MADAREGRAEIHLPYSYPADKAVCARVGPAIPVFGAEYHILHRGRSHRDLLHSFCSLDCQDMLGDAILNQCPEKNPVTGLCEPTWARVEKAVPVMRYRKSQIIYMCITPPPLVQNGAKNILIRGTVLWVKTTSRTRIS